MEELSIPSHTHTRSGPCLSDRDSLVPRPRILLAAPPARCVPRPLRAPSRLAGLRGRPRRGSAPSDRRRGHACHPSCAGCQTLLMARFWCHGHALGCAFAVDHGRARMAFAGSAKR